MRLATFTLSTFLLLSAIAGSEETAAAPGPANAGWDRLKTLVGSWKGTAVDDGKTLPSKTKFKLVSANSVLMNTLDEGTPHEMVTMFHMDLQDLLATHYCAAKTQPRMKVVPGGAPNQLIFEFKDGTNIGPNDGHMQRLIITFVDRNHHTEDWVFLEGGKESTGHFDFRRAGR